MSQTRKLVCVELEARCSAPDLLEYGTGVAASPHTTKDPGTQEGEKLITAAQRSLVTVKSTFIGAVRRVRRVGLSDNLLKTYL